MEMSKHTPGPWEFIGEQRIVASDRSKSIARISGLGRLSADEWLANARLIAAAPELYEALVYITTEMEATGGWPGDDKAFAMGMAAIAKAEGK